MLIPLIAFIIGSASLALLTWDTFWRDDTERPAK